MSNANADVLSVLERYQAKASGACKVVLVSTPNREGDLTHKILTTPIEDRIYKVLKIPWQDCVDKVFSMEDVRKQMKSKSFEREYNLSYSHYENAIFSSQSIDRAIILGRNMTR